MLPLELARNLTRSALFRRERVGRKRERDHGDQQFRDSGPRSERVAVIDRTRRSVEMVGAGFEASREMRYFLPGAR